MEIMTGDKLGRQGRSGGQEQPRMEIMKRDKLGRQGGNSSQEQPRVEIMKGDKLGRQGGSQEQPRLEIMKGDKLGEARRQRQPSTKGDKAAPPSRPLRDFGDQQTSQK